MKKAVQKILQQQVRKSQSFVSRTFSETPPQPIIRTKTSVRSFSSRPEGDRDDDKSKALVPVTESNPISRWLLGFDYWRFHYERVRKFREAIDKIAAEKLKQFGLDVDSKKNEALKLYSETELPAAIKNEREKYESELKGKAEEQLSKFGENVERVQEDKQRAFGTTINGIADQRVAKLSQDAQKAIEEKQGVLDGDLNLLAQRKVAKFSSDIHQVSTDEQGSLEIAIDRTKQTKYKEFVKDLEGKAVDQSQQFSNQISLESQGKQTDFKRRIDDVKASEESGFLTAIQKAAKDQKTDFEQSLEDQSKAKVDQFSADIKAIVEDKKEELTSHAVMEEKKISQVAHDVVSQSLEKISASAEQKTHTLIKELDQKNEAKIQGYATQLDEKEKEIKKDINELTAQVKQKAREDFYKNYRNTLIFSLSTIALPLIFYGWDRIKGCSLRENALEALDYFLELDSQDPFLEKQNKVAELKQSFEDTMRQWDVHFIPKIMQVRAVLILLTNSNIEIQKNFWVAQLLLLCSEPELSNQVLGQMNTSQGETSDPAVYLTRGIIHLHTRDYKKAGEAFKSALDKEAASDSMMKTSNMMKARIYIAQARLLKETKEIDAAIEALEKVTGGLLQKPSSSTPDRSNRMRLIALRDLGFLKLMKAPHITPALKDELSELFSEVIAGCGKKDLLRKQCEIGFQIMAQRYSKSTLDEGVKQSITQRSRDLLQEDQYKDDPKVFPYLSMLAKELGDKGKMLKFHPHGIGVTTDYEYALMCDRSYHPSSGWDSKQKTDMALQGKNWEMLTPSPFYSIFDVAQGFSAHAFYNKDRDELVIAFRGTKNLENVRTNIFAWLFQKRDIIFTAASGYILSAQKELLAKNPGLGSTPIKIVLTGHSLGAWLAECTLWKMQQHSSKNIDGFRDIEAVTFDSPGSADLIRAQIRSIPWKQLKKGDLPLTTYLAPPNAINTASQHVGLAIELPIQYDVPAIFSWMSMLWSYLSEKPSERTPEFRALKQILQTLHTHRMQRFLDCFDPQSGALIFKPQSDDSNDDSFSPQEIKSWPLGWMEHSVYSKMGEQAQQRGGVVRQIKWSLREEHDLQQEANYRTAPLDLYTARKSDIPPKVWDYLVTYLKTNGESDKNADFRAMRYRVSDDTITSSELAVRQLVRYAEKQMAGKFKPVCPYPFFDGMRTDARLQELSSRQSGHSERSSEFGMRV